MKPSMAHPWNAPDAPLPEQHLQGGRRLDPHAARYGIGWIGTALPSGATAGRSPEWRVYHHVAGHHGYIRCDDALG